MADGFQILLKATIDHLKDLRAKDQRFVSVDAERLKALVSSGEASVRQESGSTVPRRANVSRPQESRSREPRVNERESEKRVIAKAPPARREEKHESAPQPTGSGFHYKPLGNINRQKALLELQTKVSICTQCSHLAQSRTQTVFGVGNPEASLMFIGEAPGMDEDRMGEPFVGKAGQLLTRIIQAMGLTRESVYIANILKCRPDTPGKSYGNRKPEPEEMNTCKSYVFEQINIIQPSVIVALGSTALQGLLNQQGISISRARGNWTALDGIPLMPTYHPSYLLHKESNPTQAIIEKRKVWEDMLQVMEKMELPISEKQKRFFTKK